MVLQPDRPAPNIKQSSGSISCQAAAGIGNKMVHLGMEKQEGGKAPANKSSGVDKNYNLDGEVVSITKFNIK